MAIVTSFRGNPIQPGREQFAPRFGKKEAPTAPKGFEVDEVVIPLPHLGLQLRISEELGKGEESKGSAVGSRLVISA